MPAVSKKTSSAPPAESGTKRKRRGVSKTPEFAIGLQAIRKEVAPKIEFSNASIYLLNDLLVKYCARMTQRTESVAKYEKKNTIKGRHVSTAANMINIGELAPHAHKFAMEAVSRFEGKAVEA